MVVGVVRPSFQVEALNLAWVGLVVVGRAVVLWCQPVVVAVELMLMGRISAVELHA